MQRTNLRIARETRLEVTLKPGAWVDPRRMLEQIARGGFEARAADFRLVVTGTLRRDAAGARLELDDLHAAAVALLLTRDPADRAAPDAAALVPFQDRTVRVEGLWRAPATAGGPATILYHRVAAEVPRGR